MILPCTGTYTGVTAVSVFQSAVFVDVDMAHRVLPVHFDHFCVFLINPFASMIC